MALNEVELGSMQKTSINLSDADLKALKDLMEHFETDSASDVLRRSLAQTSNLAKFTDDNGNLRIKTADGDTLLLPKRM